MPETETVAPQRATTTITFTDGRVETYETGTPRMIYDTNRLGVMNDDVDAGFFMLWLAAGKPGLNGHPLTIDAARPALEAWIDTVASVESDAASLAGPPTTPPEESPGSAA